jgi:hypothetical protein
MTNRIIFFLALFLLPLIAFAQNEGDDVGLGGGGSRQFCAGSDGKWRYSACSPDGELLTTPTDSTTNLESSVIPVSNSEGLNGSLIASNVYYTVGTDAIEAASTTTVLVLTAHAAREGDWIVPTGGTAANLNVSIPVCSTTTNSVTLCYPLPATPSTDAITIRRPVPIQGDTLGRVNTSLAAAGDTWSGCTGLITNTTPAAVKAAVATHRIFVTSLTCYNDDDTATILEFQDASAGTTLYRAFVSANTTANMMWNQTFPVPLKTTAGNGFFVAAVTTAANVRCCGAGYSGVN